MEQEDEWWRFIALCTQIRDAKLFGELLELFLTIEERQDLVRRYALVKLLLEGKKTQREIAAELKVSISKITRGSNALKTTGNDLKEVIKKS